MPLVKLCRRTAFDGCLAVSWGHVERDASSRPGPDRSNPCHRKMACVWLEHPGDELKVSVEASIGARPRIRRNTEYWASRDPCHVLEVADGCRLRHGAEHGSGLMYQPVVRGGHVNRAGGQVLHPLAVRAGLVITLNVLAEIFQVPPRYLAQPLVGPGGPCFRRAYTAGP